MSIQHWPESERPREKLLHKGAAQLSDAELLAIFLRTGIKGVDALQLAKNLLVEFGGLRNLMQANRKQMTDIKGLGTAKYAQLQAALELTRRYFAESLNRGHKIQSVEDTETFFRVKLKDHHHEIFACLFLDNQHRVIFYEELFHGTVNYTSVHPRQIVKRALYHNASAAIIAHNHPSGNHQPSQADRDITEIIQKALGLVDVKLLDHIIMGEAMFSFAQHGYL